MKDKLKAKIEERTGDLNRLLEHKEAIKKELNNTNLDIERMFARIMELKELLDESEDL